MQGLGRSPQPIDRPVTFVDIDGAHVEGGRQPVRTAVATAAAPGVLIRIRNVRARRRNPGLAAQHAATANWLLKRLGAARLDMTTVEGGVQVHGRPVHRD